jgi:hypothetical protein
MATLKHQALTLDYCLRWHETGNLRDLKAKIAHPKHSDFKEYEPGDIHIDVKLSAPDGR